MNSPRRVFVLAGLVLFSGCAMFKGRIKANGIVVQSPKDGNGASLAQEHSTGVLTLPAGSKLTTVKESASPAMPATETTAAIPAKPATERTEITLSRDTTWQKEETKVAANTGQIDNTVAVRRIQAAENRYLLFAAIGAAVAGGFFLYIKYPTPAMMCAAASVVFFLAWKLADLPEWFWAVGALAIGGGLFLYLGHRRGESDGVKAVVSGNIESPTPKVLP